MLIDDRPSRFIIERGRLNALVVSARTGNLSSIVPQAAMDFANDVIQMLYTVAYTSGALVVPGMLGVQKN